MFGLLNRYRMKAALGAAVSSVALATAVAPASAQQEQAREFNIPAQPLSSALMEYSRQSDTVVVVPIALVRDMRAPAVQGSLTPSAALDRLIQGTGLRPERRAEGGLTLVQADSSSPTRLGASDVAPSAEEEIIVTAQKREERLIDTPQSVSVVGAETLESLNALQFRDYANTVPGLTFLTSGAGQNQVALRGITAGGDVSPTVGIYVDEVPYGSSTPFAAGAGLSYDIGLFDLERIEILRGPQGTLYGASTMGGLIKYVTRAPDLDEFQGRVRTGLSGTEHGGYNYDGSIVLNVPVTDDVAAFRIGAYYAQDGGYINNNVLGAKDVNQSVTSGARIDFLLEPSNDLSIRLVAASQEIERDGRATADHTLAGVALTDSLTQSRSTAEPFDQSFWLASGTLSYDFGDVALTSISSFHSATSDIGGDISPIYVPLMALFGRTYGGVNQLAVNATDRFTQEVRLSSDNGGTFEWLAGYFYTKEDSQSDLIVQPFTTAGAPATPDIFNSQRPSTYEEQALFGNLTWNLTDRFDVTAGLRYAENEITTSQTANGLLAGATQRPPAASDEVVTYLANARYQLTDRATAYFRYATGYRPGGPNFVTFNSSGAPTGPLDYGSDTLDSYELGLHAETNDRRFGIDGAVYYIEWDNIQVQVFRPATGFGGIINSPGGATVRGAELAGLMRPVEGLAVNASLTYQDAALAADSPLDLRGRKGDPLPNVPEYMAVLSVDYDLPFGALAPSVGATLRYVGERTSAFTLTPTGNYHLPEYTSIDLRARFDLGVVEALLFARNVTDERGELSALTGIGTPRVTIMQPRTIGVSLSTSF